MVPQHRTGGKRPGKPDHLIRIISRAIFAGAVPLDRGRPSRGITSARLICPYFLGAATMCHKNNHILTIRPGTQWRPVPALCTSEVFGQFGRAPVKAYTVDDLRPNRAGRCRQYRGPLQSLNGVYRLVHIVAAGINHGFALLGFWDGCRGKV